MRMSQNARRRCFAAFCMMVTASTACADAQTRDPLEFFFDRSFNKLAEEVETARKEGKSRLLIMFNDPDCPWCAKMKATVQEYYRSRFWLLHIDTRGDTLMNDFDGTEMAEKDFAFKLHRVRATPVFMFFDLEGHAVTRYTGATRGVDELLWLGEFVASGGYKTRNFTRYKAERLAAAQKGP